MHQNSSSPLPQSLSKGLRGADQQALELSCWRWKSTTPGHSNNPSDRLEDLFPLCTPLVVSLGKQPVDKEGKQEGIPSTPGIAVV